MASVVLPSVETTRHDGGHERRALSLPLFVVLALVPITMLFYFIDRHWYHRLLLGAVLHCGKIEEKYKDKLPEIQLGGKISELSPVSFPGRIWKWIFFYIKDERFTKHSRLHSDQKIEVMYKSVIYGCFVVVFIFGILTGIEIKRCKLIPYFLSWPCTVQLLADAPILKSEYLVPDAQNTKP